MWMWELQCAIFCTMSDPPNNCEWLSAFDVLDNFQLKCPFIFKRLHLPKCTDARLYLGHYLLHSLILLADADVK